MTRWYVVHVKAHREPLAGRHLERRGVEVFYPRLRLPRYADAARPVVPMFPGYVFVHVDLPAQFDATRWSPGVRRFVGWGGAPAALESGIVDFLRDMAREDGVIDARPDLAVGRQVRVSGGPFDGLAAVIQRPPDARGRVKVLMELLTGRVVSARLPVQQVAAGWIA